jgi:anti-sigma B factor antagonist
LRAEESVLQGLEITIEEKPEDGVVPVVHLKGEIDLHTCPELRTVLQDLMDRGEYRLVLDLAQVPYLDSAALGVLVDAVRRARENGGGIHLVQVAAFVQRAFEITRLVKIFEMHSTIAEAQTAAKQAKEA